MGAAIKEKISQLNIELRKLLGTIVRHSTHTKEKAHHERCGEREDCCCSAGEVGEGEKNLGVSAKI